MRWAPVSIVPIFQSYMVLLFVNEVIMNDRRSLHWSPILKVSVQCLGSVCGLAYSEAVTVVRISWVKPVMGVSWYGSGSIRPMQ